MAVKVSAYSTLITIPDSCRITRSIDAGYRLGWGHRVIGARYDLAGKLACTRGRRSSNDGRNRNEKRLPGRLIDHHPIPSRIALPTADIPIVSLSFGHQPVDEQPDETRRAYLRYESLYDGLARAPSATTFLADTLYPTSLNGDVFQAKTVSHSWSFSISFKHSQQAGTSIPPDLDKPVRFCTKGGFPDASYLHDLFLWTFSFNRISDSRSQTFALIWPTSISSSTAIECRYNDVQRWGHIRGGLAVRVPRDGRIAVMTTEPSSYAYRQTPPFHFSPNTLYLSRIYPASDPQSTIRA
ncbi:hypothetical protein ARMGADRAFT_1070906 [Armillaria gallica]|uniref:Uncharacterized protein n=1 Tax=Armillaria gallica TaxID=47427 RepID=A0A2H3F1N1_ARMGA|nr:hypothetical protein ARMGADRAFT_1070906 [Armillaria gallica]